MDRRGEEARGLGKIWKRYPIALPRHRRCSLMPSGGTSGEEPSDLEGYDKRQRR